MGNIHRDGKGRKVELPVGLMTMSCGLTLDYEWETYTGIGKERKVELPEGLMAQCPAG
jgi:hypothetical protein